MTALDRYWPRHDEVNRCIKSQAETVSEAVLLAVHQSCPIAIRNAGSSQEVPATERELLDAFLTENLPEGMLLLAITGASGAGKSHMIRWLDAQLKRDPRAEKMHVIRIPKSASLRTVVDLITEPLEKDPRYADARAELKRVTAEVTPEVGAVRFSAGLELALRALADGLLAELRENPQAANAKEIKVRIDHARKLPALFGDAVLRDHFLLKVLARIVDRAVRGRDANTDEDDNLSQFSTSDLEIPDDIDLGQAAIPVRVYYQTVLSREGGKGREEAVAVLNYVVNDAIAEVFQLRQALGGVTLEDIILRIRDLLFEDKRELVLLIEDFAALSGIQETLLHVSIQEAVRDGRPVRAVMRTAVALTDGYLGGRDTILSRAKKEWVIRTSLETKENVIDHTYELIGAYLNAARWGESNLEQKFKESRRHPQAGLTEWVPVFNDENKSTDEADLLAGFEVTRGGVPLFPFNRAAVQSLAQRHLTVGERLVFNPRRIIDFILRDVLLVRRDEFERAAFPPAQFEGANPTAEIADWLSRAVTNTDVRGRLASFLVHWGGNPKTTRELASLKPELFKTFGLPTPKDLGEVTSGPKIKPTEQSPGVKLKPEIPIPPAPQENQELLAWRDKLEEWAAGKRLGHQDTNLLRNEIVRALSRALDWNAMRHLAQPIPQTMIQIPHTSGQNAPQAISIADNHSDPNGSIRRILLAFINFYLNDHQWSYPGGDEDSAVVANFVDVLVPQFTSLFEANAGKEVAALRDLLVRQGRIVGLSSLTHPPDQFAEVTLAPAPEIRIGNISEQSSEGRWLELQKAVATLRPAFQKTMLARIGCFQGIGSTAYAIDIVRLANATLAEGTQVPTESGQAAEARHVTDLQPNRLKARIQPVVKGLVALDDTIVSNLGPGFDNNAFVDGLLGLINDLEAAAAWPGQAFNRQDLLTQIEAFRNIPIADVLQRLTQVSKLDAEKDLDALLDCVGRIDLYIVDSARQFIAGIAAFLKAIENTISSHESVGHNVNPNDAAAHIQQTLSAMLSDLDGLICEEGTP